MKNYLITSFRIINKFVYISLDLGWELWLFPLKKAKSVQKTVCIIYQMVWAEIAYKVKKIKLNNTLVECLPCLKLEKFILQIIFLQILWFNCYDFYILVYVEL